MMNFKLGKLPEGAYMELPLSKTPRLALIIDSEMKYKDFILEARKE